MLIHVDYHYWGDLCTDSFMSTRSRFLIASILPKSLSCVGWISSRKADSSKAACCVSPRLGGGSWFARELSFRNEQPRKHTSLFKHSKSQASPKDSPEFWDFRGPHEAEGTAHVARQGVMPRPASQGRHLLRVPSNSFLPNLGLFFVICLSHLLYQPLLHPLL